MSGFEENPFGEPNLDNPFADPAVQQVTQNTNNVQRGLEDYNPFAEQPQQRGMQVRGAANPPQYQVPGGQPQQGPAVMQPSTTFEQPQQPQPLPPPYAKSAQQSVNTAELQRRQEELERKAQELARREEELRSAPYNVRKNNWPPLPQKFCMQPCFYQDINVEIPLEFQKVVRLLYYLWMFHTCVLFLNFLGGLALLVVESKGTMFGLSIIYLILFTPFSYVCWFRPAYKAFRSDSSFNFMVFFFVFFFQLVVSIVNAIGIPDMGSCGFIVGITTFHSQASVSTYVVGGMVLIIALGFAVEALMVFLMLVKVHRIYRSTGASFAKAQQEFTSGVLRNEHVQSATADIAAGAVRAQMANAATSPRY